MIGAGRLGFPVGCVMAGKGHRVTFYDINTTLVKQYQKGVLPYGEQGLPALYERVKGDLRYAQTCAEACRDAEIIFIAVPTPHLPEQDGSVRFNKVKADFNLDFVKDAVFEIVTVIKGIEEPKTVVVISTMLPGSMDREIAPLFDCEQHALVYSPSFIAQSTVVHDFENPEFWLIGVGGTSQEPPPEEKLMEFYLDINRDADLKVMSWSSAEAAKVFYNTFITMKLTITNTIMEIADRIPGCDCDDISDALQAATQRVASPAYMRGGMVDGGGCHPRDNIALSWLSAKLRLDYNLFEWMMEVREKQVEYLAKVVTDQGEGKPIVILGTAFKTGTHLTYGSPSLLLANILGEWSLGCPVLFYDTYNHPALPPMVPSVYVLGVNSPEYLEFPFVPGSTIVDPWGAFNTAPEGCELVSIGREK
jgi:UDPglucose 6-dehydrogenase